MKRVALEEINTAIAQNNSPAERSNAAFPETVLSAQYPLNRMGQCDSLFPTVVVDLSLWQKLWNKGVDIIATSVTSALSALLTAVIALAGWKLKKKLDLQKEMASLKQKADLEAEILRDKAAESRRQRISQLKAAREAFAQEARNVRSRDAAEKLSVRYTQWLEDTKLITWNGNLHLSHKWGNPEPLTFGNPRGFGESRPEFDPAAVDELRTDILETDIPDETESAFPW